MRKIAFPEMSSETSKQLSFPINRKFNEIVESFRSYLEQEKIEISKIKWFLKNAVKFPPIFKGSHKYSSGAIDDLKEKDYAGIMEVILSYCSFFNYGLLDDIIHVLDFELGKDLMKSYKEMFIDYVKGQVVSDHPSNLLIQSDDVGIVSFVLDEGFKDCHLYYLEVLKEDISKILGIRKEQLRFKKSHPGSSVEPSESGE